MSEDFIKNLARPNVRSMTAYQSARGGVPDFARHTLLDAAENPYSPFDDDEGFFSSLALNRYPEPHPEQLADIFSDLYSVPAQNIAITRGSEEGIRLLLQVFCAPGKDKILTCPPTFAMYETEARIHDTEIVTIPRTGENKDRIDTAAIIGACNQDPRIKIVFLCNPGNPASTALPESQVTEVIEALDDKTLVVVDEAYIEFADHVSFTRHMLRYKNLIVLRSLSKSYGLAGLRCGCILAPTEAIRLLKLIMAAYPVSKPMALFAIEALSPKRQSFMQKKREIIKAERDRMIARLAPLSSVKKIYPSQANFLCIESADPASCIRFFRENGILIRDRGKAIPGTLNIAVGTKEQNDRVIALFEKLSERKSSKLAKDDKRSDLH